MSGGDMITRRAVIAGAATSPLKVVEERAARAICGIVVHPTGFEPVAPRLGI
jgi:hypothetical protein